jgi:1,2-diacylglycerol 3-alpha-glucosyltransferase
MKIVIIFHNIGGYHVSRICAAQSELSKRNWTLTAIQVINSSAEHPWGDIKNKPFAVKTLIQDDNEVSNIFNSQLVVKVLLESLDIIKPDVVVVPGWGDEFARAALAWTKRQRKISILMSESKWNDSPRYWWREWIKSNLFVKKFDAAIVGGESHRSYLLRLGFSRERIFTGYDVVDNDYFTHRSNEARENSIQIRQQYPEIPTNPYFIVVTRFILRKNVSRLIQSFAGYREQFTDRQPWDLVICGSGKEEEAIRKLVLDNHLNNCVHLPGFITYHEIPKWFALANVFIHPALQEQWGLVVNEAMAARLPVLVSNSCGCFPELVLEGINGFGFDPENTEQLTELMLKMSSRTVDLQKMGEASQSHIQNFSPEHFAEGLYQAVECAVKRKDKKT